MLQTAVTSAPFFGNDVLASLAIPSFGENFDSTRGELTDPDLDARLRVALAAFSTVRQTSAA